MNRSSVIDLDLAIPCHEPNNPEDVRTIVTLAEYVSKNGKEFEEKIKGDSKNANKFAFLFNVHSYNYMFYLWRIYVSKHNLTPVDIDMKIKNYINHVTSIPPGLMDLTSSDRIEFNHLLDSIVGTRESIAYCRSWILDRSHSIRAIGDVMLEFTQNCNSYSKILNTIYVINDVLFDGNNCFMRGIYLAVADGQYFTQQRVYIFDLLMPQLVFIMKYGISKSQNMHESDAIYNLILLWCSHGLISEYQRDQLDFMIRDSRMPIYEYNNYPIYSPFPEFYQSSSSHDNGNDSMMTQVPNSNFMKLGNHGNRMNETPPVNLYTISVGKMANILNSAKSQSTFKKYNPIDTSLLDISNPYVEPARLEAQINEFYRKYHEIFPVNL